MMLNVATSLRKWDGGNFNGVCHGTDQAVSICTYPELSCVFWIFKKDVHKTPECVLTCQGNLDSKHSCQRGNPKIKNI